MALILALVLVCAHQWDGSFLTAGKNIPTEYTKSYLNMKCSGSFIFVTFLTVREPRVALVGSEFG